jgi:hypothetical protein
MSGYDQASNEAYRALTMAEDDDAGRIARGQAWSVLALAAAVHELAEAKAEED